MISVLSTSLYWPAVEQRDARYDGVFVYGVLSTHIFCRPTCPARRPRREGVQFFDSAAAATAAGFRACKRCCPERAQDAIGARVKQACQLLAEKCDAPPSLAELARSVGVSGGQLQRSFKRITGVSPHEYSQTLKLQKLKQELQTGVPLTQAMLEAGYNSSRGLYEGASVQMGMTPGTYRKGGAGKAIAFDVASCALGLLLVATTEKGICSVALGDDAAALEAGLRREFFAARLTRDRERLKPSIERVVQLLEGELPNALLPLDVQATAFQARVWQKLQAIRRGETRSYSQVARSIGQPTAARAVARACATNPVALLIPCHRVVRENGAPSGYRWGLSLKRELLQREQATPKAASGEK